MLRITVEILPLGIEVRKRTLAIMEIANIGGQQSDELGNYKGTLYAEYTGKAGRVGYVNDYKRKTQSVWSLVGAFLKLWGHTKHSPKLMHK